MLQYVVELFKPETLATILVRRIYYKQLRIESWMRQRSCSNGLSSF